MRDTSKIIGYKTSPDRKKTVVLYDLLEIRMGVNAARFYLIREESRIDFTHVWCWFTFRDKVLWDESSRYFYLSCGPDKLFIFDCEKRQSAIVETSFYFSQAKIAFGMVGCRKGLSIEVQRLNRLNWRLEHVGITPTSNSQLTVISPYKTDVEYNESGFPTRVILYAPNGQNRLVYRMSTQSGTLENRASVALITETGTFTFPYEVYGWGRCVEWGEDSCGFVIPVFSFCGDKLSLIVDIARKRMALLATGYDYLYDDVNTNFKLFKDSIVIFNRKYEFSLLNWEPLHPDNLL